MSAREVAERLRKRRRVEKISTDEGPLYVRGLTGAERANWAERFVQNDLKLTERILGDQYLVAIALCDESGQPLYGSFDEAYAVVCDFQDEDVKAAAKAVMSISGMGAKAEEEAGKKSAAIQN